MYAGTLGGGVLRSDDNGGTWSAANTGLSETVVRCLVIDPISPSKLYAGTDHGGVFRSIDGGDTWTVVNNGLAGMSVWWLAINPLFPSSLYACTWGQGIFRTTDAGDTWTTANAGLTTLFVRSFAIDPVSPSTQYAGTEGGGAFRSADGGVTWTAVNMGPSGLSVLSLAINPLIPTILYAGTGSGCFRYGSLPTYTVTPSIAGPGQVTPTQQTGVPSGGSATFTVTIPAGCYAFAMSGNLYGSTWVIDNVRENISPVLLVKYLPTGNIVRAEIFRSINAEIDSDSLTNAPMEWTDKWTAVLQNLPDASGLAVVNPTIELEGSPQHISWWEPNDPTYYSYDPLAGTATWHLPTIDESGGFTATALIGTSTVTPGFRMTRTALPSVLAAGTTVQNVLLTFTLEDVLSAGTDHVTVQIGDDDPGVALSYVQGSGSCDGSGWTLEPSGSCIIWSADVASLVVGRTYTFAQQVAVTLTSDPSKRYTVKPNVVASIGQWREQAPVTLPHVTFWSSMLESPAVAAEYFADNPVDWDIVFTTARRNMTMKSVLAESAGQLPSSVEGSLRLAPQQIQLKGNGLVQAFLSLPDPYTPENIIPESVRLCGLEPLKIHIADGCLVATFTREQLRAVLPVLAEVKIPCTGTLTDNLSFKASCLASVSSGAPEQYNQEVVLAGNAATTLWPFEPGTPYDLSGALFRGLLGGRPNGELYADLATALPDGKNGTIQLLGDGSTKVTVSLRPGLRWSDGYSLTVNDIRFAYDTGHALDLLHPCAITILNSSTVEMVWQNLELSVILEELQFPLLPQHAFDLSLPASGYPGSSFFRDPIVCGPYKVETFTDGVSVTFVPNGLFSGTAPTLQRITVLFLDAEATGSALQSGSIDMVLPDASPIGRMQYEELLPTIETNYRTRLTPTRSIGLLSINLARPLLGPREYQALRTAMIYAIDANAISRINLSLDNMVIGNVGAELNSTSSIAFCPFSQTFSYDPALARRILDDNGYTWRSDGQLLSPTGVPVIFRVEYASGVTRRTLEAQYLQSTWWTTLGISAISMGVDFNGLLNREKTGDYDISLRGFLFTNYFHNTKMFDPRSIPTAPDWVGENVCRFVGSDMETSYDQLHVATSIPEIIVANWYIGAGVSSTQPIICIDTITVQTIIKRQLQGVFFPLAGSPSSLCGPLWNVGSWRVGDPAPLAVVNEILPTGKVNQAFVAFLHASGGSGISYSWAQLSGELPPGLNINSSGTIAGVPVLAGTYKFSVQVTDINGTTGTSTITIIVQ
jgi:ABC-type transport system substrate-binding protein